MKIFCMPQAFKGTLKAMAAAEAMAEGVRSALPHAEIELLPMADGGDDTLDILVTSTGGMYLTAEVWDPIGRRIPCQWGLLGDGETAVIEMAQASGLRLLKPYERDPRTTSSVGTGQLIRHALDLGYRKMLIGAGGSATVDGGMGAMKALGVHFRDARGLELHSGGAALAALSAIDLRLRDRRLKESSIRIACDMRMPLCGPRGAWTFAAQKGASEQVSAELEQALERFAQVVGETVGVDLRDMDMAGSAGGLAGGLSALLGAELHPGADLVMQAMGAGEHLKEADIVLVGEGRMDRNTFLGKGPGSIAQMARDAHIPVLAVVGSLSDDLPDLASLGICDAETLGGDAASAGEEDSVKQHVAEATARVVERFARARVGGEVRWPARNGHPHPL